MEFGTMRNKLGDKLITTPSSRLRHYTRTTLEFKDIIKREIKSSKNEYALQIKELYNEFKSETKKIVFDRNIDKKEITRRLRNTGGTVIPILGRDESIVTDVLFETDKSPYAKLMNVIQQHAHTIYRILFELIDHLEVDTKIDMEFWTALKKIIKRRSTIEKFMNAINDFCSAQKHNHDTNLLSPSQNVEESDMDLQIGGIRKFWKKIITNTNTNYPKYIQEHLIDYNIEYLDKIFDDNMAQLSPLIKEPNGIDIKRDELDRNIYEIKLFMEKTDVLHSKITED